MLQFVWKPVKPEDLPKTDEERAAKIKELVDKIAEVEKNHPAVTMPKVEEIQAASLKKSKEIDSQIEKAFTPAAATGDAGVWHSAGGAARLGTGRASRTREVHVLRGSDDPVPAARARWAGREGRSPGSAASRAAVPGEIAEHDVKALSVRPPGRSKLIMRELSLTPLPIL